MSKKTETASAPANETPAPKKTRKRQKRVAVFPASDGSGRMQFCSAEVVQTVIVPKWLPDNLIQNWIEQGTPAMQTAFQPPENVPQTA